MEEYLQDCQVCDQERSNKRADITDLPGGRKKEIQTSRTISMFNNFIQSISREGVSQKSGTQVNKEFSEEASFLL